MMKKKRNVLFLGLIFTVLLIAADQVTKYLASVYLSGMAGISVIDGVFQLFYLENRGAAFGMLDNRQGFFIAVAAVMCIAAAYVYWRLPLSRHFHFMRMICVLIAAGSAGNMIDRLLHGYVIDFLYFSLIDFPCLTLQTVTSASERLSRSLPYLPSIETTNFYKGIMI